MRPRLLEIILYRTEERGGSCLPVPSALKREYPELQNITFLIFLFLWVIFALLDPDQDPDSESEYGSTDLIESGSNPDPVPKHCIWHNKHMYI